MTKRNKVAKDKVKKKNSAKKTKEAGSDIEVTVAKSTGRDLMHRDSFLMDIEREVDRAFDRMFKGSVCGSLVYDRPAYPSLGNLTDNVKHRAPSVDVLENGNDLLIKAELAGVNKDDIEVSLDDHSVTINVKCDKSEELNEDDYHRREIFRQYSSRSVKLPSSVDTREAQAGFKDGVLTVTAPKLDTVRRRTVPVT